MPATTDNDLDVVNLDQAIADDLQDRLYQSLLLSQLMSVAGVLISAWLFIGHSQTNTVVVWAGYLVGVAVLRIGLCRRYQRAMKPRNRRYWARLFLLGVVMAGGGWGAASLIFFNESDTVAQMMLIIAVAGIATGAVVNLSASFTAAAVMLSLCLMPLLYVFASAPGSGHGHTVLISIFYLMAMLMGWRSYQTQLSNARLTQGNQQLVDALTAHATALEKAKAQDEAEREMALAVFQAIVPHQALAAENLAYHLSSHSAFNGDLLLVENRPDGRQNLMLGDFTGHGLAASLGAIPAADIFVSMTRKGFPLHLIAAEINRKLYTHLPRNLFCAACLVEIDSAHRRVRVWNGGLPSVYLRRTRNAVVEPLASRFLPLGVLSPSDFDASCQAFAVNKDDVLFMATDGVIEQRNASGEMFGADRLESILHAAADKAQLAIQLRRSLRDFSTGASQDDDLTFVALRVLSEKQAPAASEAEILPAAVAQQQDWSLRLDLQSNALKRLDPVPLLNHLTRELNGDSLDWGNLELVLGELYKNALDHGVLGMDSAQKTDAEGFEAYYRVRDERLAALDAGSITIAMTHLGDQQGGVLDIKVSDSGQGFSPFEGTSASSDAVDVPHGRGLSLVRALCHRLVHNKTGNQAEVSFRWRS